jgi:uncharacterized RDD family membrane protein YckC
MLDTLRQVETPEGVILFLRPAGVVPRGAAWAIDALFRFVLYLVCATLFGVMGVAGFGITALVMFLLYWFYMVLFECLNHGRTPGKLAMGLRVVSADALPVGWIASLVRNLLRVADMLPALYGFGLASMLVGRDGKRLGDRVAGTLVVHDQPVRKAVVPKPEQAIRPPFTLSTEEQVTLLSFAERSGYLTDARQMELADLLEPVTGLTGPKAVKRLLAYAGWIAGRR